MVSSYKNYSIRNSLPEQALPTATDFFWLIFLISHVPLALLMKSEPLIATGHALLTLIIGLGFSLLGRDHNIAGERTLLVAAYISGVEVLWRSVDAAVFWEYGKYSTIAVLGISLLRRPGPIRLHPLPVAYFMVLLPSITLWFGEGNFNLARQLISSTLSGPLCLAMTIIFCYQQILTPANRNRLFLAIIAPTISLATIALHTTLTTPNIKFGTSSNFITSGGFGPVQVSAALSLGILACFLYIFFNKRSISPDVQLVWGLLFWFLTQALLSFSRTGAYISLVVVIAMLLFYSKNVWTRPTELIRTWYPLIFAAIVTLYIIVPRLDNFTSGFFTERFTERSTTHRIDLMDYQLQIWRENPIAGVGPGRSSIELIRFFDFRVASHSEITRLLAEHGILGLVALLLLIGSGFYRLGVAQGTLAKIFVLGFLIWAVGVSQSNGLRTAAPAFIYGLTWITLQEESE